MTEDQIPDFASAFSVISVPLGDVIALCISEGIGRADYLLICESMWDTCPFRKDKGDFEDD